MILEVRRTGLFILLAIIQSYKCNKVRCWAISCSTSVNKYRKNARLNSDMLQRMHFYDTCCTQVSQNAIITYGYWSIPQRTREQMHTFHPLFTKSRKNVPVVHGKRLFYSTNAY